MQAGLRGRFHYVIMDRNLCNRSMLLFWVEVLGLEVLAWLKAFG